MYNVILLKMIGQSRGGARAMKRPDNFVRCVVTYLFNCTLSIVGSAGMTMHG